MQMRMSFSAASCTRLAAVRVASASTMTYRSELHFHETPKVMFGFRLRNVFDFFVDLFNLLPDLIPDDR